MEIHLCKPGGQREGPFSLEQINDALAARKYTAADYWAWYPGLAEWVPLYSVPGVSDKPAEKTPTPAAPVSPEAKPKPAAQPDPAAAAPTVATADTQAPAAESEPLPAQPAESPDFDSEKLPSDMPFAALDHSFLLTSGDGPEALRSEVTQLMLQRIVGEHLTVVRSHVPRDVVGRCNILQELKEQNSIPGAVWKKMAALRPELMQQARDGVYRICVRSFRIENGDTVSLFLFYNKQKFQPE